MQYVMEFLFLNLNYKDKILFLELIISNLYYLDILIRYAKYYLNYLKMMRFIFISYQFK